MRALGHSQFCETSVIMGGNRTFAAVCIEVCYADGADIRLVCANVRFGGPNQNRYFSTEQVNRKAAWHY
jgi:hypothetical protein